MIIWQCPIAWKLWKIRMKVDLWFLTCGETIERAVENAADAKKAWLEAALEEGIEIHEPGSLEEYSGQFKIRMPRSLHRDLAEHSKKEGISMNQYCIYLLSKNDALLVK